MLLSQEEAGTLTHGPRLKGERMIPMMRDTLTRSGFEEPRASLSASDAAAAARPSGRGRRADSENAALEDRKAEAMHHLYRVQSDMREPPQDAPDAPDRRPAQAARRCR